jgi:imidazolonepropionase-like amidohydrolase
MAAAGMPVLETLKSATSTNARLLGIDDKLGQLQADKLADIVAVPGNPVDDVNLMQQVNFVMKGGEIVKQP